MTSARAVKLFRNGRNQAVRIPREFERPGEDAVISRDGDRLIIELPQRIGLLALLETLEPIDEAFDMPDDPMPEDVDF